MSSFTGVSIVDGEQCCCEASAVVDAGGADSGCHLLFLGPGVHPYQTRVAHGREHHLRCFQRRRPSLIPQRRKLISLGVTNYDDNLKEPLLSFSFIDQVEKHAMVQVMEDGQEKEAAEDDMLLQWLQHLLVAADRYDVQRLKCICEKQLSENIGVSTVMSLALAEQHHCQGLKEACFKFIQVQSPSCLQTVMATNGWDHVASTYPSVLKELFLKFASNQRK